MNRIINHIIIAGGGSAGWMAAAYMRHNLPQSVKITLVESTAKGILGVGEGTQPYTTQFLKQCGLDIKDWMSKADATFKLGVELDGWGDNPVFVDNDTTDVGVLGNEVLMSEYVLGSKIDKKDFMNWIPSYRLGRANKSPKFYDERLDYAHSLYDTWDAVHFKADQIVSMLSEKVKPNISYYDDEIIHVHSNDTGVTGLQTKENGLLCADLYVDCTGFKSLLLEQTLKEKFIPIDHILLCNRAVAIPKKYTDKNKEMHPYTKAIAMESGWRWSIPTFSRIGNGYVYSDKFITPEEAEFELRSAIDEWEAPANHLQMKTGTHEKIAKQNVFATGLAAAFVEPLEATGITFTTKGIESLTTALIENQGYYNDEIANNLSINYNNLVREIIDFVFLHYHFASKNDTPFWQAVHNIDIPTSAAGVLNRFVPNPTNKLNENGLYTMFHAGQWFQLLYGLGAYDNVNYEVKKEILDYGKMVWDKYNFITDQQLELFPNHYQFLKEWYDV